MSPSTPTRQTRAQRRANSLELSLRTPSPSAPPSRFSFRRVSTNGGLGATSDASITVPTPRRRTFSLRSTKDASRTSASTRSPVSIFASPRSLLRPFKTKPGVEASLRAKKNLLNESPSRGSASDNGGQTHSYHTPGSSPSRRKRSHSSFGLVTVLGKVKGSVDRIQNALERVGKAWDGQDRKALRKGSPRRKRGRPVMHLRLNSDELDKIAPFRKFEQHPDPEPDNDVDMTERALLTASIMDESVPFDSPMAVHFETYPMTLDSEGPFADLQPASAMSIDFGNDIDMPLTPMQMNIGDVEERGGRRKVMQFFGGNPGSEYFETESVIAAREKIAREKSALALALLG